MYIQVHVYWLQYVLLLSQHSSLQVQHFCSSSDRICGHVHDCASSLFVGHRFLSTVVSLYEEQYVMELHLKEKNGCTYFYSTV